MKSFCVVPPYKGTLSKASPCASRATSKTKATCSLNVGCTSSLGYWSLYCSRRKIGADLAEAKLPALRIAERDVLIQLQVLRHRACILCAEHDDDVLPLRVVGLVVSLDLRGHDHALQGEPPLMLAVHEHAHLMGRVRHGNRLLRRSRARARCADGAGRDAVWPRCV